MKKLMPGLFFLVFLMIATFTSCIQEDLDKQIYADRFLTRSGGDGASGESEGKCGHCKYNGNSLDIPCYWHMKTDEGATDPTIEGSAPTDPPSPVSCQITCDDTIVSSNSWSDYSQTYETKTRKITMTSAYRVSSPVEVTFTYYYYSRTGQQVYASRNVTEKVIFTADKTSLSHSVYEYYKDIPESGTPPEEGSMDEDQEPYVPESLEYRRLISMQISQYASDHMYNYTLRTSNIQMPATF